MNDIVPAHENGHFYSPIVNPDELRSEYEKIWPNQVPKLIGIDLNESYHEYVLREVFGKYYEDFQYPEQGDPDTALRRFYIRNSQFSWLDARALFVLLREWRPNRIIEVGSGYSTVLISDVNERFLSGACKVLSVEPYPRPFLKEMSSIELLEQKVQHVPYEVFEQLESGDILFIDSSHVSKTGSDVNYLYFEILPRLKPGVRVHVHDIFFPLDYPVQWVLEENRSWNEQYVLRALLTFSKKFRVLFGSMNAFVNHKESLGIALRRPIDALYGGGSIWLECG
ncbi:class I SAM-dependent methyltransferase [Rudaea sp.]|uniref:class I SAM-dependent methyltransferase n=1 Tax=Rudaea sp. TaxID=2136325 RepID=UPI002ED0A631